MAEMDLNAARAEAERRVRVWLEGQAVALDDNRAMPHTSVLTVKDVERTDPAEATSIGFSMRALAKTDAADRLLPAIQSVLAGRLDIAESGLDECISEILAVTGIDTIAVERAFVESVALRALATWCAERMAFEAGKIGSMATPSIVSPSLVATPEPVTAAAVEAPAVGSPQSNFLSFWELYVAEKLALGDWKPNLAANAGASKNLFRELVGDLKIVEISREKVTTFRSALLDLPASYKKDRKWVGMSLADIIAERNALPEKLKEEIPTLSETTRNKHLTIMGTYFNWLQETGRLDGERENPFGVLKGGRRRGREARDERSAWSLEMQLDLFGSPVWTGCKSLAHRAVPGGLIYRDDLFLLPLLGRTMGARSSEICSRKVGDCIILDGVCCLAIPDSMDAASRRKVPFAQLVLDLGFFEYRVWGRSPDEPLFPELIGQGPADRESEAFGRRFSHYCEAIKCRQRVADFQSFRLNVIADLGNAGVKGASIAGITGRPSEARESETDRREVASLKELKEAIDWVAFPVDMSRLRFEGPRGAPAPGARDEIATFRKRAEREIRRKQPARGRNRNAEAKPRSG